MKSSLKILLILLLISLASCHKNELKKTAQNETYLPYLPPPPANLHLPDVILNDLAKGEFNSDIITFVSLQTYATPFDWMFQVLPGTKKIKTITVSNPNYRYEETVLKYFYNDDNLIKEIISIRDNSDLEFLAKHEYKYYYESGILTHIVDSSYFKNYLDSSYTFMGLGANYFSYNSDGTISEIYIVLMNPGDSFNGYNVMSFSYDADKNIIQAKSSNYNVKYTYIYNQYPNPFKGVYVYSNVNLPGYKDTSPFGPSFISNNCLTSHQEIYVVNDTVRTSQTFIYDYNYSNNKILDFGLNDTTHWFRNFITY